MSEAAVEGILVVLLSVVAVRACMEKYHWDPCTMEAQYS